MKAPGEPKGLRTVRALARLLLRLYPRDVRREMAVWYVEAAEHRWRKERRRGGVATFRTTALLVVDALRAVPRLRRGGRVAMRWRLLGEVRLVARSLARSPGFAALVVVILGTGVGASAAIFGVLDRFLLRPLPYADGDRMVLVALELVDRGSRFSPNQEVLELWRQGARTVESLEVFLSGTAFPTDGDRPEPVDRMEISGGLPAVLGVRPVEGRLLGPDDARAGAAPVLMVGERYWRTEMGGDPAVVGRSLSLNDTLFTVVGVWPEAAPVELDEHPDVWTAMPAGTEARPSSFSQILGVLAPGASPAMAEDELTDLMGGMTLFGRTGGEGVVATVLPPYGFLGDDFVLGLRVAFVGVALLLMVAVANAASLLLNRAVSRGGELGVRLALGASGGALVRLFMLESGLLAGAGAAFGAALARWGGAALAHVAPERFPDLGQAVAGPRALLWGLATAGAAALVCGLVPGLRVRSPEVRRLLTGRAASGGRAAGWLRSLLVAFQVGLAVVLVVGAGLTVRSLRALSAVDPGFDLERLAIVSVSLPEARYPECLAGASESCSEEDRIAFHDRAVEALESLPGVERVTTTGQPPLRFSTLGGEPRLAGEPVRDAEGRWTSQAGASPGYFEVMGIPILEGSGEAPPAAARGSEERYIVVNDVFARRYTGSVVGRRLAFPTDTALERTRVIVGVVGSVHGHGLADDEERVQYYVVRPEHDTSSRFILRASGSPSSVLEAARSRLLELDPLVRVRSATTGPEILRSETADQRFLAALLGIFGAIAVGIAVLGVFGSVSLAVRRRTHETGVRLALGAGGGRVVRHVLLLGLRPVAPGIVVGVGAALALARYVAPTLYGVGPSDPSSFLAGVLLIGGVAFVACLLPARRALRTDPVRVLREE